MPEPKPLSAPAYTDAQVSEAKTKVCDAFNLVHNAIFTAGNKDRGSDPTTVLAMVANGRLAFIGGSQYLLDVLNQHPAASSELDTAARQYASSYQQLGLGLLADKTTDQMDQGMLKAGDDANDKLKQICQ